MSHSSYPGKLGASFIQRDKMVSSPSYVRPYPFVMDHGKGVEVWDVDNNRFLDFTSGIAVVSTGHSHPLVVKAIQEQAEKFIHISSDFYHPRWVELSEKLAQIAPFREQAKIFLCNSGTEAIEAAIKLARYHTGRDKFIAFYNAFHGRTMGALSMMASKAHYRKGFFPTTNGVFHAPFPDPLHPLLISKPGEGIGETVVRFIEEQIFTHLAPPSEFAGILLEPIQGEGGYIIPPPDFLPALRKLCDKHGILLIDDEVQTGIGRTGKWWGIQHFNVEPDIVAFAKGVASGIPLGGIIAKESVMSWTAGSHGNTFGGNPIACVAALTTLQLVEKELMQNAAEVGHYALEKLQQFKLEFPFIFDVRGKGLMLAIEVLSPQSHHLSHSDFRDQIVQRSFENGLLILGCGQNVLRLIPPLVINKKEMDEGLHILYKVFKSI